MNCFSAHLGSSPSACSLWRPTCTHCDTPRTGDYLQRDSRLRRQQDNCPRFVDGESRHREATGLLQGHTASEDSNSGNSSLFPIVHCRRCRSIRNHVSTNRPWRGMEESQSQRLKEALRGQSAEGPPGSSSQFTVPSGAKYGSPPSPGFSTIACPFPSVLPHHTSKSDLS